MRRRASPRWRSGVRRPARLTARPSSGRRRRPRLWNVSDASRMSRAAARRAIATTTGYPPGKNTPAPRVRLPLQRWPPARPAKAAGHEKSDDLHDADYLPPPARFERLLHPGQMVAAATNAYASARTPGPRRPPSPTSTRARTGQDQQGVGFHVEPRAECTGGPRPPGDPPIDAVERGCHRSDDDRRRGIGRSGRDEHRGEDRRQRRPDSRHPISGTKGHVPMIEQ